MHCSEAMQYRLKKLYIKSMLKQIGTDFTIEEDKNDYDAGAAFLTSQPRGTGSLASNLLIALDPFVKRTFGDAGFLAEGLHGFSSLIPNDKGLFFLLRKTFPIKLLLPR